jgi:hypothetical protein
MGRAHNLKFVFYKNSVLKFVVSGGIVYWNPTIYYGNLNQSLHLTVDGYMGDVHPIYDNNKLYMFYLDTSGKYNSRLLTSEDMINFELFITDEL